MAAAFGLDDMAQEFRSASLLEQEHAAKVRGWVARSLLGQAGARPTPARAAAPR